jgi:hypothetical protein
MHTMHKNGQNVDRCTGRTRKNGYGYGYGYGYGWKRSEK